MEYYDILQAKDSGGLAMLVCCSQIKFHYPLKTNAICPSISLGESELTLSDAESLNPLG